MADMATTMLSVEETRRRILESVQPLAPIDLPLAEAHGCVMARDVVTEYDIPPFSSAMVDGFAARAADVVGASPQRPVTLRVAGRVLAGRPPEVTVGWGEAARISQGAPVPAGADAVVPASAARVEGESVLVGRPVQAGTAIRPAGEDLRAGSMLVPAGRRLSAAELGILATAGFGTALTYPKVRVAVVSVGELVEPGRPAGFGQVRDAVSYGLVGALRDVGAVPYRVGIVQDVEADLRESLLSNLSRADAFICAGGATEEEGDRIGLLLAGLGDVETYRAAMRPGGTIGFGVVDGQPFFSLPAEAAAALVSFEVFVRPAILRTMGRRDMGRPEITASLETSLPAAGGAARFVPARVSHREGAWRVRPTGPGAGNRLGAVVAANGLVLLDADDDPRSPGDRVRVQIFRPLER
jgi:molybdopterin molybdotransferase